MLGLEVVLADGSVIRTGGKNSQGRRGLRPDRPLRRLRGNARAHHRGDRAPAAQAAAEADAAGLLRHGPRRRPGAWPTSRAAGIVPVTLELMDAFTIAAVDDALQLGLRPRRRRRCSWSSRTWAATAARSASWRRPRQACVAAGATSVARLGGHAGSRLAAPGTARRARRRSSERAPRAWMTSACRAAACPEMIDRDRAHRRAHTACRVGVFGHAGDGNLHPTYVLDRDDPDAERAHRRGARRDLPRRAGAGRHGHRRARHGVWPRNAGWSSSAAPMPSSVMRSIKQALDPRRPAQPRQGLLGQLTTQKSGTDGWVRRSRMRPG